MISIDSTKSRRTALITGATSGIGAEYARQLAVTGYDLVLHGRREAALTKLAGELSAEHGISASVLIADLANDDGIAIVERAIDDLPDLRLLVNNAGYGDPGLFQDRTTQSMLDMMKVHNEAVVRITHAAVPQMIAAGQGGIINVSSVAAWIPGRGSPMYYATKAFLNSFSRTLDADLAGTGIAVQALCPGFTHTEFHGREKLTAFDKGSIPTWMWMDAKDVVKFSLARLGKTPVVVIPGWRNRVFAWMGGHVWLLKLVMKKRR